MPVPELTGAGNEIPGPLKLDDSSVQAGKLHVMSFLGVIQ